MKLTQPRVRTLFLLFLSLTALSCGRYKMINVFTYTSSSRQIQRYFAKSPDQPSIFYFRSGDRTLRGWTIGADSLPATLLLHGSPSSMVKFRQLCRDTHLLTHTRLVAVDRPGYGGSNLGRAEVSIEKQAEAIAPLLRQLSSNGKVIILGMSYGGPVAAKLAMDQPEAVRAIVLLSASVQPHAEKTPFIAHLVDSPLGVFFPRYAHVATAEKMHHADALEAIQDEWDRIECPVWILHGLADPLIYFSNAEHAYSHLAPHTDVTLTPFAAAGHNILRYQPDTIRHYLLEALECTGGSVKRSK